MSEDLQALVLLANEVEHHVLMSNDDDARDAIQRARKLLDQLEKTLEKPTNIIPFPRSH